MALILCGTPIYVAFPDIDLSCCLVANRFFPTKSCSIPLYPCDQQVTDHTFDDPGSGGPGGGTDTGDGAPPTPYTPRATTFATSRYGLNIPLVFGSDRLETNIMWQDDPVQEDIMIDGKPFFYNTLNFAAGICAGPINGVLRIWAGDMLIFNNTVNTDGSGNVTPDASGFISAQKIDVIDPESPLAALQGEDRTTQIQIFNGSSTQRASDVIIAKEGIESTPAYRNLAYIVFEKFITADGNLPEIYVEVVANTTVTIPRLTGALENTDTFDEIFNDVVVYNPFSDRFLFRARKLSAGNNGYAVFDGSSLVQRALFREGLGGIPLRGPWVTAEGYLVFASEVSNSSEISVYDSRAGAVVSRIGTAGSSLTHTADEINTPDNEQTITMTANSGDGTFNDFVLAVGTSSRTVTVLEVKTANGEISRASPTTPNLGAALGAEARLVPWLAHVDGLTWVDTKSANGEFAFAYHHATASPAPDWDVRRYTLYSEDTKTPAVPMTSIDHGVISKSNWAHITDDGEVAHVLFDHFDMSHVIIGRDKNTSKGFFVKYNPVTNKVVRVRAFDAQLHSTHQSSFSYLLAGEKWAYIDALGKVFSVDLNTLESTELFTLSGASLGSQVSSGQYYNGFEETLTYLGTDGLSEFPIKLFIDRITYGTTLLGDVTRNLLGRVGVPDNDIVTTAVQDFIVTGYTVERKSSLKTIFSEIAQVFKFDLIESNGKIVYQLRGTASSATVQEKYLGQLSEDGWLEEVQDNDIARTRKLSLSYRDIGREYETNVQAIQLPKVNGSIYDAEAPITVDVPIVMTAANAKSLAEILLYSKNIYNSTYSLDLPPRHMTIDPGDVITVSMDDGRSLEMRTKTVNIGADRSIELSTVKEDGDVYNDQINLFGTVGRYTPSSFDPRTAHVPFQLIEVPYIREADADDRGLFRSYFTILTGQGEARYAEDIPIKLNNDDNQRYTFPAPAATPTWGIVQTPLDPVSDYYATDTTSSVTVKMANIGSTPPVNATADELNADPALNLVAINKELVQFQNFVDNGDDTYTFTNFYRARNGTDSFVNVHLTGDRFIMVSPTTTSLIEIPAVDHSAFVLELEIPNKTPFFSTRVHKFLFLNLRPFSVSGINATHSSGDVDITWIRRTRYDGPLEDGTPTVPLNELEEKYTIAFATAENSLFDPSLRLREVTNVSSPSYTYTAAQAAEDGYDPTTDTLYFLVSQIGETGQGGSIDVQVLPPTS